MRSAMKRAKVSIAPPAAVGTTIVIGREGEACPKATGDMAGRAAATAARCRNRRRENLIMPPGDTTSRYHPAAPPGDATQRGRLASHLAKLKQFLCLRWGLRPGRSEAYGAIGSWFNPASSNARRTMPLVLA